MKSVAFFKVDGKRDVGERRYGRKGCPLLPPHPACPGPVGVSLGSPPRAQHPSVPEGCRLVSLKGHAKGTAPASRGLSPEMNI